MATPIPQVVLFGDSLFQKCTDILDGFSFQAALQSHCIRRYDVVNRGLSGYNTSQALEVLPSIFTAPSPGSPKMEYLLILFGANDAALPGLPTNNQHVPIDKYAEYLTKIIAHPLITAHRPKIFVVTPPPIDEFRTTVLDTAAGHPTSVRRAFLSADYADVARKVAYAAGPDVKLVDLYAALMDVAVANTPGWEQSVGKEGRAVPLLGDPAGGEPGYLEQLLPDGLHLSGEAYRIFFNLIWPLVGEWAAAPEDDKAGYVLPDWRIAPKLEH